MLIPRTAAEYIAELEEAATDAVGAAILVAFPERVGRFVYSRDSDRLAELWRLMDAGGLPVAIVRDALSERVLPGEVVRAKIEAVIFDEFDADERIQKYVIAEMAGWRRQTLAAGKKVGPLEIDPPEAE